MRRSARCDGIRAISVTGQVVDLHSGLGSVPIEGIRTNALSRVGIPLVLRGLQLIRYDEVMRERQYAAFRSAFPSELRVA